MTLFKSLLLGSAVGIVAVAGAQAADLPSKKAAPATYVKICDAYGAGFFFIPGTDTCLKVAGRVRYDLGYAPKGTYYGNATTLAKASDNGKVSTVGQDLWGQHTRGQLMLDARTSTGYGVVRTYTALRLSQSYGLMGGKPSPIKLSDADDIAGFGTGPTFERAFIQFAGFTAGRSSSIFANGPSLSFGANSHFPSFANGTMQLAYTAVLGGGLSVTVGMEDPADHKMTNASSKEWKAPYGQPYDTLPVLVGNIGYDQSWGRIQVSGAYARDRSLNIADSITPNAKDYDFTKSGFAYAAFLTYNADMVGKGDKFYLLGGFSSGMNLLGYKDSSNATSSNARDIDGIAQSYSNFTCNFDAVTGNKASDAACQNTKTTWLSGAFVHNWTSTVRQNVMAGMAWVDPGSIARATSAATQKATFSSIGTNVIWSPVKDFDIGVEVLYNKQSVGNDTTSATNNGNPFGKVGCNAATAVAGCRASGSMVMSRIRIERTF